MIRVSHVIHTTGIGGVEAAADSIARGTRDLDYRVLAFREDSPAAVSADCLGTGVNSLRSVRTLLADLTRTPPDVLVTSLWRSVLIGLVHRLVRPRVPWIVYLHSTRYTNLADRLAHVLALRIADRILCDSRAVLDALVPLSRRADAEVVHPDSALLRLAAQPAATASAGATGDGGGPVRLIYWGRAAQAKRLDRAIELVRRLEAEAPGRFVLDVIAPPSPLLDTVLAAAGDLGPTVRRLGPGTAEEILTWSSGARFFLQLSDFEGLAMAVREALALGIVPIVTPVGAIRSYTTDGVDAVHVAQTRNGAITPEGYSEAARRIVGLAADRRAWAAMSQAARAVPRSDFISEFEAAMRRAVGRSEISEAHGDRESR